MSLSSSSLLTSRSGAKKRSRMHPEMIHGWWPKEIVRHLQIFYNDLIATLRKFWGNSSALTLLQSGFNSSTVRSSDRLVERGNLPACEHNADGGLLRPRRGTRPRRNSPWPRRVASILNSRSNRLRSNQDCRQQLSSMAGARQGCRKNERSSLSSDQLVEQCPGLFQIERVVPFCKPAVDRSEKIARLIPLPLVGRAIVTACGAPSICWPAATDRNSTTAHRR
jgi:hypothetical protein